jgi:glutathione synthase/RimK-type ligase-like ATP-grasp enzyme
MAVVLEAEGWMPADSGPWVVQPVVHTVKEEGEISVFVIGGRPVSQVRKVAPRHDFRVHEEYGGVTNAEKLSPDAAMLAADAIAVVSETLGVELVYGRVDLMRYDGNWVVSEIEVTEPGLYLDELPGNAELFVDALAMHLT